MPRGAESLSEARHTVGVWFTEPARLGVKYLDTSVAVKFASDATSQRLQEVCRSKRALTTFGAGRVV